MPEAQIWSEVLLILMGLLGIALNSYVLHVVLFKKKVPLASDTVLMGLIATFDLIACFFTIITQPLKAFGLVVDVGAWCWSDLIIFSTSTFASLSITSALSMVRYLSLVCKWKITLKKSILGSTIFLILVWIIIITRGSLNGLAVMPSELYCMPPTDDIEGIREVIEIIYVILLLPCPFIIFFSYAVVGFRYHSIIEKNATASAQSSCSQLGNLPSIQRQMRGSFLNFHRKRIFKLVVVIVSYTVAIAPEYVYSSRAFFFGIPRTQTQDTIAFLFMFPLAIINPFFVLEVRQASSLKGVLIELQGNYSKV